MADVPLRDLGEQPSSAPVQSLRAEHFLPHAEQVARQQPEHLKALGMTAEQYARALAEPGLTLDEAVASGLMSEAEARFIAG